jgi:hypothetical protein
MRKPAYKAIVDKYPKLDHKQRVNHMGTLTLRHVVYVKGQTRRAAKPSLLISRRKLAATDMSWAMSTQVQILPAQPCLMDHCT